MFHASLPLFTTLLSSFSSLLFLILVACVIYFLVRINHRIYRSTRILLSTAFQCALCMFLVHMQVFLSSVWTVQGAARSWNFLNNKRQCRNRLRNQCLYIHPQTIYKFFCSCTIQIIPFFLPSFLPKGTWYPQFKLSLKHGEFVVRKDKSEFYIF